MEISLKTKRKQRTHGGIQPKIGGSYYCSV